MCNTSLGYNQVGVPSAGLKTATVEYAPQSWICPKVNSLISWKRCRESNRDFAEEAVGGIDCWECKNLLKLRLAESKHKDDKITAKGVALVILLLTLVFGWCYAVYLMGKALGF